MDFYVNGNKIDITLENEKTIGDILRAFEEECSKNSATTISIFVNGKQVLADNFDTIASQKLLEDTKFELGIVTKQEIAEAFQQEAITCREIATKLEQIPTQLQSGKDKEANVIINQLADIIDTICHTTSLSTLFPDAYGKLCIGEKAITDFFADFATILTDFEHALQAKDTVLTGDLAEYEISPRLIAFADAMEQTK